MTKLGKTGFTLLPYKRETIVKLQSLYDYIRDNFDIDERSIQIEEGEIILKVSYGINGSSIDDIQKILGDKCVPVSIYPYDELHLLMHIIWTELLYLAE